MNFKIFLVVCAVIVYEANAQGNSWPNEQRPNPYQPNPYQPTSYRNTRRPYSSWIVDPGVAYASQGGPVTGLTYNILGLIGDGARQITGGITSAISGVLQTLGQLGADIGMTFNPQSPVIVPPFAQPVPKDPEPVNTRPTPRPPQDLRHAAEKFNSDIQNGLHKGNTKGQNAALNNIESLLGSVDGKVVDPTRQEVNKAFNDATNIIETRRLPLGPEDKVDKGRSELRPL